MATVKLTWCDEQGNAACIGLDETVTAESVEAAKDAAEYHAQCQGIDLGRYHVEAEEATDEANLVCGCQVQVDRSGVGHCWVNVTAEEIPGDVRLEIEGEIIDGGRKDCDDFVASNGLHYRW